MRRTIVVLLGCMSLLTAAAPAAAAPCDEPPEPGADLLRESKRVALFRKSHPAGGRTDGLSTQRHWTCVKSTGRVRHVLTVGPKSGDVRTTVQTYRRVRGLYVAFDVRTHHESSGRYRTRLIVVNARTGERVSRAAGRGHQTAGGDVNRASYMPTLVLGRRGVAAWVIAFTDRNAENPRWRLVAATPRGQKVLSRGRGRAFPRVSLRGRTLVWRARNRTHRTVLRSPFRGPVPVFAGRMR